MQTAGRLSRRDLLRASGLGLLGSVSCSWLPAFAAAAEKSPRHLILLWMSGGPTQTDTFDMKPEHANGGQFKPIDTNVSGIQISEHLPGLAKHADKLAIVRGLSTTEGDHGRGTFLMRTGERPGGNLKYPAIGSSLSKELGTVTADLPNYFSIASQVALNPAAFSPGFLGPKYAAASVSVLSAPAATGANAQQLANAQQSAANDSPAATEFTELGVDFLRRPSHVSSASEQRRLQLWQAMEAEFLESRKSAAVEAHQTVYQRALRVMQSASADAFDLQSEPVTTRQAYGPGVFGQGCLLARRLIERGVPVVEVTLDGWDTHVQNFESVQRLSRELDAGWSALLDDLQQRGLLESTTILWMGEFGRTPVINEMVGRDHFPAAWSCVFAGGGIRGGQVHGKTSPDGMEVVDQKVSVKDVLATLCRAVGVADTQENMTNLGRPIKIVDGGNPIKEILS
jgi:hypothetical protein